MDIASDIDKIRVIVYYIDYDVMFEVRFSKYDVL